ncbi:hypothetical protein ACMYZ5_04080 [Bacteroides sp. KG68]
MMSIFELVSVASVYVSMPVEKPENKCGVKDGDNEIIFIFVLL